MHPGITGWAQVNGSRGETVEVRDMEERIRYDLEYIKHWSLGLDFKILFRTISTVLNTKNTY
jgi:putative colanic acid biosynthesis UDP-glucose lipid carrier transferase